MKRKTKTRAKTRHARTSSSKPESDDLTDLPTSIATLLNARRRDAELIGIDPEPIDVTPDLRTYLAQKAAEDEAA